MSSTSREQAGACMWRHPHGPHDIPALLANSVAERVLHLDVVNTIPCGGFAGPDRYVITTPAGFTETFDERQIDVLVRLGLVEHERDGYVLDDGHGNVAGPLHHFYRETR